MNELAKVLAVVSPIEMTSKLLGRRTSDGWTHDAWRVTLTHNDEALTVPYRQGVGFNVKPPELASVLESLLSDAAGADQPFADWAGDLGYDADSRKALATYHACGEVRRGLIRLFGQETFEKLLEVER